MSNVSIFFLHVGHQGDCCGSSRLGKFEHSEHPVRNVAKPFFGDELQDTTVSHLRPILQAENHGIFISTADQLEQLVESRRGEKYFISFFDVLSKSEGSGIDSQPI